LEDKTLIDALIEKELGGLEAVDTRIRGLIRQAFAAQYATVTSPPKLGQDGRTPSLGDYYTQEVKKLETEQVL